jgi:hypothetical protein
MKAKKAYHKPQVTKVDLKPEEAVLSACKSNDAAGPSGLPCPSGNICKQKAVS